MIWILGYLLVALIIGVLLATNDSIAEHYDTMRSNDPKLSNWPYDRVIILVCLLWPLLIIGLIKIFMK